MNARPLRDQRHSCVSLKDQVIHIRHTYTHYECFRFIPKQDFRTMFCDSQGGSKFTKYGQLSEKSHLPGRANGRGFPYPFPEAGAACQSHLVRKIGTTALCSAGLIGHGGHDRFWENCWFIHLHTPSHIENGSWWPKVVFVSALLNDPTTMQLQNEQGVIEWHGSEAQQLMLLMLHCVQIVRLEGNGTAQASAS